MKLLTYLGKPKFPIRERNSSNSSRLLCANSGHSCARWQLRNSTISGSSYCFSPFGYFRGLGAFGLHRTLRGLFQVPQLGWRDGEDRPPGHSIVRQTPCDSADAPGQILGPRGKRQTHAAHVYESAPGRAGPPEA